MHPLRKQPLLESLILLAGMISIMLLIQGTSTWIALSTTKQTPAIAKKEASELTKVAASTCAYSTITLEPTMTGDERIDSPSKNLKVYDPFEGSYNNDLDTSRTTWTRVSSAKVDSKLPLVGSIFGYKPSTFRFYKVNERSGNAVPQDWLAYLLGIPTSTGVELKAPRTGYDIGGGKMGLVTYATSDQIAIHIGRHEYLTGVGNSTAPGYEGKPRSGGYWIYLKGIKVNPEIVKLYNENAITRDKLPALRTGDVFACAAGSEVKIAVRDNGPFQDILGEEWWSGVQQKTIDSVTQPSGNTPNPQSSPAVSAVPAVPAAPGAPATTTPGPAVPVATIQASIILPTGSINKVKKLASEGGTQLRTKILLLGDENTANPNFKAIDIKMKGDGPPTFDKYAEKGWGMAEVFQQVVNLNDAMLGYKYALISIGAADTKNFENIAHFEKTLTDSISKLAQLRVIPIVQTIPTMVSSEKINKIIIEVAQKESIPYINTSGYLKQGHMTRDGLHYNTMNQGPGYCNKDGNCDPPEDIMTDSLLNPISGYGIRNVILREAIGKLEKELDAANQSIVVSVNTNSTGLKPLTLLGVQAQTAPESIISILQSYGSSGYLCYDFGGLSCVPATLSTIEGRAVRVDVTVDRSYPAKPICVSRTNSCNGGIFLDPNL